MSLGPKDQTRLARILQQARELEKNGFPVGDPRDRRTTLDLSADSRYQNLKREIADCAQAEDGSLRRLAGLAGHLHDQVSLHHFFSFIVPFERLSGRALRDDEFLVTSTDDASRVVERLPLKLITENLRSSFNVGAIFRTSECLGVSEIILGGYTPGPDDDKTLRTSMGTADLVPWRRVDRARTACEDLRGEGYRILALETADSATSLFEFEFSDQPCAFVLGNERFGIEAETLQMADAICRIPVRGVKNSMNVGIAFGVAGFEWLRQHEGRRS